MSNKPFKELSEIQDVKVEVSVGGKNYALAENKEKAEKEGLDIRELRIAYLSFMLAAHDLVEIKEENGKDV